MQSRSTAANWKTIITLALALLVLTCNKGNEELEQTALRADDVYRQYRTADYATAKTALLSFIRDLEARLNDPSTQNVETFKSDIALSYARLAKLEEKNNGPEQETYMQQATAKCRQLKIKRPCSPQDLRAQVDAADAILVK